MSRHSCPSVSCPEDSCAVVPSCYDLRRQRGSRSFPRVPGHPSARHSVGVDRRADASTGESMRRQESRCVDRRADASTGKSIRRQESRATGPGTAPAAFRRFTGTIALLERCQSGRMGRPAKALHPLGAEGSNPSLSAHFGQLKRRASSTSCGWPEAEAGGPYDPPRVPDVRGQAQPSSPAEWEEAGGQAGPDWRPQRSVGPALVRLGGRSRSAAPRSPATTGDV